MKAPQIDTMIWNLHNGVQKLDVGSSELLSELFRALAAEGRGIEINTSGLRTSLGAALPELALLEVKSALNDPAIKVCCAPPDGFLSLEVGPCFP